MPFGFPFPPHEMTTFRTQFAIWFAIAACNSLFFITLQIIPPFLALANGVLTVTAQNRGACAYASGQTRAGNRTEY